MTKKKNVIGYLPCKLHSCRTNSAKRGRQQQSKQKIAHLTQRSEEPIDEQNGHSLSQTRKVNYFVVELNSKLDIFNCVVAVSLYSTAIAADANLLFYLRAPAHPPLLKGASNPHSSLSLLRRRNELRIEVRTVWELFHKMGNSDS